MEKILEILEDNARLSAAQIATMLDRKTDEVKSKIEEYEQNGIIAGYHTLIDWDKTDKEYVSALIEVKITPQRDMGFDKVAEKIYRYPEVKSVFLMSGGFDLAVFIEGKTMKEVALFVAQKLAPIEFVNSTATHFVLRKYKDNGRVYGHPSIDERESCN